MPEATEPSAPRPSVWWRALLLSVPLFVIGFGVGAYVIHYVDTLARPGFSATFDEHMISQYAYLQYQQASYREAQAALEKYLKVLSSPGQSPNPLSDSHTRGVDSMLTYGRLALLHERNGRPDLAETSWQHAERLAKENAWKDPSRERIRWFLERLDSQPAYLTKSQKARPN